MKKLILTSSFILLTSYFAPAATVEAEGRAPGDMKTAREQALADALREAVRVGTGVDVLSTTYCGIATSSLASASVPAGAIIIARWDLTGAPGTTAATQSGSAKTGSLFSDGVSLIRCPTVAYSGGS